MNRLLTFLIVASLAVIAASAFIEQAEDSEVADFATNEALADADPEARRRKKCKNGACKRRKAKKSKKAKKAKKGKKTKKAKGGKRTMKQGKCARQTPQCGIDAVAALKYEGSAVDNFRTQRKRALNFKTIVEKKKAKKANFDNSSASMLEALGGNDTAPTCGMAALRFTRKSAATALSNYGTLKNCSANIESKCAVPAGTLNETKLDECEATMNAIKTNNKKCCAEADAAAKCTCFAESAKLVAAAKASGCSKVGKDANNAMKTQKKTCTTSFGECNTAEAAATGLINICLGGEDVTGAAAAGTTAAAGTGAAGTTAAAGSTMAAAKTTMASAKTTMAAAKTTAAAASTAAGR